jgi:hypothetical protein
MFGALTIKVQRVARIFFSMKRNLGYTPRFMSSTSQVFFTLAIVSVQMTLVIISLAVSHPEVQRSIQYDHGTGHVSFGLPEVFLTCTEEEIAVLVLSLLYETALIATATLLGVMSFKFPNNFNEAKCISFCTLCLLVVWIGLIPTYFTTEKRPEIRNAAISFFIILSAFGVLISIFGPKMFIILFHPERNNTNYSTPHYGQKTITTGYSSGRSMLVAIVCAINVLK